MLHANGIHPAGDGRVQQSANNRRAAVAGPEQCRDRPGIKRGYATTFEIARQRGMRVGYVSTAPSSHISRRACQGPADTRARSAAESNQAGGLG